MKMITMDNVSKTYGDKTLFEGITFTISEKERVGLIGVNGTGKSSLLKIVAGIASADKGEIICAKDYSISFLRQQPDLQDELTVLEQVFHSDAPIISLMKEYENMLIHLQDEPENKTYQEKWFDLQKKMDAFGAWDANSNAKAILTKLGITDFSKKIGECSGGQKKRVALAQVLIESPDLLILDEPTNHLDFETIKWLEDYLRRYNGALLIVTHDRYFLDKVTNRIFELDGGNIYTYKGNYADFLEAKAIREEQEAAQESKRQNLFRQELQWIRRGAKARTTKQKARIQRFEDLEGKIGKNTSTDKLDIALSGSRLGKKVLELISAEKQLGNTTILKDFNLLVKRGDRLGIVGRNGAGKSTLLNILAGKIPLDSGEMDKGETVKIAYYTQESEDMDENKRMIQYIKESAEMVSTSDGSYISAAQILERFLFPLHTHGTPIRKLSGGEKRRLYLLKLLMTEPNVLLLDEPTNDLDTLTLTVLEDYLDQFPGVVITVSHDRYFLDKVVGQLLVLQGDGIIDKYFGSYTDYIEGLQAKSEQPVVEKKVKEIPIEEKPKKKKMSYKEKKEWEEIDGNIESVESRLEKITEEMATIGSNFVKGQELVEEEKKLNEELEYLIERWSVLSELAESE